MFRGTWLRNSCRQLKPSGDGFGCRWQLSLSQCSEFLLSQEQPADYQHSDLDFWTLYSIYCFHCIWTIGTLDVILRPWLTWSSTGNIPGVSWELCHRNVSFPAGLGPLTSEPLHTDVDLMPTEITSSFDSLRRILLAGCAPYKELLSGDMFIIVSSFKDSFK
jgi:hypothetical protein